MFNVQVKDAAVTDRSGTKNGKNWHMRSQQAWVMLANKPYPVEVTITLADQQPAFAVGNYVLDATSAWVTRYGELRLDLTKLKPAAPAAAPSARSA